MSIKIHRHVYFYILKSLCVTSTKCLITYICLSWLWKPKCQFLDEEQGQIHAEPKTSLSLFHPYCCKVCGLLLSGKINVCYLWQTKNPKCKFNFIYQHQRSILFKLTYFTRQLFYTYVIDINIALIYVTVYGGSAY